MQKTMDIIHPYFYHYHHYPDYSSQLHMFLNNFTYFHSFLYATHAIDTTHGPYGGSDHLCSAGHSAMVELLLKAGADTKYRNMVLIIIICEDT